MAKGTYVGVAGVARKVKSQYVGVAGVARKVKKAYAGVAGVARLCWQSGGGTAIPTFAISPSTGARSVDVGNSISWTVTTNSDGEIYATVSSSSGSTSCAYLRTIGNTVTAKGLCAGSVTVEIGVGETGDYAAAKTYVTLTVTDSGGGDISV